MKLNSIICTVSALTCLVVAPASAQVDKKVEVTQAFIPQVDSATKPMLEPDMTDDAYITPDIDYAITPISIHTQIDSTPYKPVEMNYWEFRNHSNFYAKLGGGYPLQSVADLYFSKSQPGNGYIMGFINHDGEYADIKNDYGVKSDAKSYHLGTGAAAGLYLGRRTLEGLVRYDRDFWSRYATSGSTDEHPLYQTIGFTGLFGDDYSDWSETNYSLGFDINHMWSDAEYSSTIYGARFDVGGNVGIGGLKFGFDYRGVSANNDYSSRTIGTSLGYFINSDMIRFSIGLKYYYDNIAKSGSSYIIPRFTLDYNLSSTDVVAYIDFDGELINNDFASLVARNPYLMSGVSASKSSVDYAFNMGLKGVVASDKFAYNIYAGYKMTLNTIYWAYVESAISADSRYNGYMIDSADQHNINFGVDLSYRATSRWAFNLGYELNKYQDDDDMLWANGMPKSVLNLGIEYRSGRFSIGVDGDLLSRREVTGIDLATNSFSTISIPTTLDLGINMEYKSSGGAIIFCDLNNLLNQDLYNYARYREFGIGAIVGVKFTF